MNLAWFKLVENIERRTLMFKLCKTHAIVAQDPAVYSRLSLFSLTVFLSLYNWGASENMDLELLEAQYRVSREQGCCCMNCIDWIYQVSQRISSFAFYTVLLKPCIALTITMNYYWSRNNTFMFEQWVILGDSDNNHLIERLRQKQ